jgi:hypothetical protein
MTAIHFTLDILGVLGARSRIDPVTRVLTLIRDCSLTPIAQPFESAFRCSLAVRLGPGGNLLVRGSWVWAERKGGPLSPVVS